MAAVTTESSRLISLRLDAGADVCAELLAAVDRAGARGATVVAAIGSLAELDYAVVGTADDGTPCYVRHDVRRQLEVASLQGHLGRRTTGEPAFHLHGVFALDDGSVVAGHLFAARVLITFEVTLLVGDGLAWEAQPYRPPGALRDPGMLLFVPTAAGAAGAA